MGLARKEEREATVKEKLLFWTFPSKIANKSKKKHVSVMPEITKDVNEAPVSGNSRARMDDGRIEAEEEEAEHQRAFITVSR